MFQINEDNIKSRAKIKIIGVGGGGGNAIKTMYKDGLTGVDFIVANTDIQSLEEHENLDCTIQLGTQITQGLGAGANPEVGRQAAIESCEEIEEALKGADMVFITAGMGGGTGTGAAGVIAKIAKDQGALTVGVVTRPFFFEGQKRARYAEMGVQFLKENVDTLIVIPNQKLLNTTEHSTSLLSAFKKVDDILLQSVKGIVNLINNKGLINLDFADVKTIMSEKGLAIIGTGSATGENRALLAAKEAISSPLLEDTSFKGALGVIINITGGADLSLQEVNEIAELITAESHHDAEIIFGALINSDKPSHKIDVTVIATGFESTNNPLVLKKDAKSFKDVKPVKDLTNTQKVENSIKPKLSLSVENSTEPKLSLAIKNSTEPKNVQTIGVTKTLNPIRKINTLLPKDILIQKSIDYQKQSLCKKKEQQSEQQLSMNINEDKKNTSVKNKSLLSNFFRKSNNTLF